MTSGTQSESGALDDVFGALSDPIRRTILTQLAHSPCSVTTLSRPFSVSAPAISKHLVVLERAGLIARWKTGRVHYCRLLPERLGAATAWIEQHRIFWEGQLDSLDAYLREEAVECPTATPRRSASSSKSAVGSPPCPNAYSMRGRVPKR